MGAAVKAHLELECVVSIHRERCADASDTGCMDLEKMVDVLRTVLTEETTHAHLAFETVRWATARDPIALHAVNFALEQLLETEQSPLGATVLDHVIIPWLAGVPVQQMDDSTLDPVLRRAMEGMVTALKLNRVTLPTEPQQ